MAQTTTWCRPVGTLLRLLPGSHTGRSAAGLCELAQQLMAGQQRGQLAWRDAAANGWNGWVTTSESEDSRCAPVLCAKRDDAQCAPGRRSWPVDLNPSHGSWPIAAILELLMQEPEVVLPFLVESGHRDSVYAACAFVRLDALPRPGQIPWIVDLADQRVRLLRSYGLHYLAPVDPRAGLLGSGVSVIASATISPLFAYSPVRKPGSPSPDVTPSL